ncbi:MAG: SDR family oxidoreductase [Pseudohongiellaceae bacterium]
MALVVMESGPDTEAIVSGDAPLAVVTGATGFIGRALCPALSAAGYRVVALTRPGNPATAAELGAQQVLAKPLQQAALKDTFAGATVVFHLAGIAHTGVRDRAQLEAVNVDGTAEVVAAARASGAGRLVYFSSIMADQPQQSAYAASKRKAEDAVLAGATQGLQAVVLRPVNVYGPGMGGNLYTMARLIANRRLPPLPRLDNRLALVSVQDLCRVALAVAQQPDCAGQVYTVSDAEPYTPTQIEAAIYQALGRKKPAWHTPRMVFFAAAAAAELVGRMGLTRSGFGLASYNTLVTDNPVSVQELADAINYQPTMTLYDALPDILTPLR